MLNERASALSDVPSPSSDDLSPKQDQLRNIRGLVEAVMQIDSVELPEPANRPELQTPQDSDAHQGRKPPETRELTHLMSFRGRLTLESEAAYELLDAQFLPLELLPIFRTDQEKHVVDVYQGRLHVKPRPWWPNLVLFLLTFASVLYVGTLQALNEIASSNLGEALRMAENPLPELWRGLPYAVSVLLILGAHELGHYFAARRHKLAVTLPYFLPFPFSMLGTLGAAIQLREPMRSRKVLLEVGAAGPLAGLVFAIPIVLLGLATSSVMALSEVGGGMVEGNSILYAGFKVLMFGEFLPNAERDVFINSIAWAGWIGLFITGLNLIPVGQLDGGHVMYALFGKRARLLYLPTIIAMGVLIYFTGITLLFMLVLIILMGPNYAVPLNDITPLTGTHRAVAVATLVIFVLVFVPVPLTTFEVEPVVAPGGVSAQLPLLTAAGIVVAQRLARRFSR